MPLNDHDHEWSRFICCLLSQLRASSFLCLLHISVPYTYTSEMVFSPTDYEKKTINSNMCLAVYEFRMLLKVWCFKWSPSIDVDQIFLANRYGYDQAKGQPLWHIGTVNKMVSCPTNELMATKKFDIFKFDLLTHAIRKLRFTFGGTKKNIGE